MSVFDDDFARIYFAKDESVGLKMIIALHDLTLGGKALGGIRIYPYESEEGAVIDAKRLARAMTCKNAIIHHLSGGDLSHGGGKAVIWGDPKTDKTRGLLLAAADAINDLGGKYIGGEDMGMKTGDVQVMFERTPHITGLSEGVHMRRCESRIGSGDPCPITALGISEGIEQCLIQKFGIRNMSNVRFSIQGVGGVGKIIVKYLSEGGARVLATDTDANALEAVKSIYPGVNILEPERCDEIYDRECDVFVPCAIGAILNDDTIDRLSRAGVKIVAGCANNQLLEPRHGEELWRHAILYAPDYVINAGGAINVAMEAVGYDRSKALSIAKKIGPLLAQIFREAEQKRVPPEIIADEIAEGVLIKAKNKS